MVTITSIISPNALKSLFALIVASAIISGCGGGGGGGGSEAPLSQNACSVLGLSARVLKVVGGTECGDLERSPVVRVETLNENTNQVFACTGTLVAPDAVLTAAHCFTNSPELVVVVAGEAANPQIVNARSIHLHPGYREGADAAFNDVAIIKLKSSLSPAPVALGISREVESGEVLSIFGFGRSEANDGDDFDLRSGQMRVSTVSENHIGANYGGDGSNTCQGDSGGPLLADFAGETVIVGITSSGSLESCGSGDRSLFTKLTNESVLSFILEVLPSVAVK